MTGYYDFNEVLSRRLEEVRRYVDVRPLVLGAISASGGGTLGRPGGFIGTLPQTRISYDLSELALSGTNSGSPSLLDNLNHIRYRLGVLETASGASPGTIVVKEGGVVVASGITVIDFLSGFSVNESPTGEANITVTVSGGHSPVTVTDTGTIDLTLVGQQLSGIVKASGISHTDLQNIGTNTHAQIDTHIADTSIHFDELGELSNVSIGAAASGQYLRFDGVVWYPSSVTGSGGGANYLNELTDVTLITPVSGQVLTYNGSVWVNASGGAVAGHTHTSADITDLADITVSGTSTLQLYNDGVNLYGSVKPSGILLGQLGDTLLDTAVSGQYLKYLGTNWVNEDILASGVLYDNSVSTLSATDVQHAIDELKAYVTPITYSGASINLVVGTYVSGDIDSLSTINDSNAYIIQETTGTPAWDIRVTYNGVTEDFNQVIAHLQYEGSVAHNAYVQLYNVNTTNWDNIGTIISNPASYDYMIMDVTDFSNYVDSGTVIVRLAHSSAGNITHGISIDYLILRRSLAGGGVTEHGGLSGLGDDDHIQYLLTNGTRPMASGLDMGGYQIFNVGDVDGVDISAHVADTSVHFDELNELSDVVTPTPASGQVLQYMGTNWRNVTPAAGHNPVTVQDTATVDLTLTNQQVEARVIFSGVNHDQLLNYDANEHFTQGAISITASQVSDFDTEVSNNTDVAANTADRHSAVTVLDTGTIDLTLAGQQVSAVVKASGISHTDIQDIGTNTHAQIDTHISDTSIHFDELNELSDVVVPTPASGQVLQYMGTNWRNVTPAAGHNPVTVQDTATVDLTLTNQQVEARVIFSGINHDQLLNYDANEHFTQGAISITASQVSDFDTEVSNNTDVAANTAARHSAVTVLDTGTIDLTLNGQQVSAVVKASGISHGDIQNIGSNTHAQIDTHISDTSVHFDELGELSDVSVVTATSGQVLTFLGTNWVAQTITVSGGTTDHGLLDGLADDDHTQYLLANGTRALTGDLTVTNSDLLMSNGNGLYYGANYLYGDTTGYKLAWYGNGATRWSITNGDMLIGNHGDTADGLLHIRQSDAGITANTSANDLVIESVSDLGISLVTISGSTGYIMWGAGADDSFASISAKTTGGVATVVVNEDGKDTDFRVEGDTDVNLLMINAGTNRVGIGVNSPDEKLDVRGNVTVSGNILVTGTVDGVDISTHASDTSIHFDELGELSDVSVATAVSGQVLTYLGTNWIAKTVTTSGGTTDHGTLTGLGDDDHTQYLLANGTRAVTGDLTYTNSDILFSANYGLEWPDGGGTDTLKADPVANKWIWHIDGRDRIVYSGNSILFTDVASTQYPKARLHVQNGLVGATPGSMYDDFILEINGNGGMTIMTPEDNTGWITWQTPDAQAYANISATSTNSGANGELVINEWGNNTDLRVEGATDTNLLFVDAGNDRVGIGDGTPSAKFEVNGDILIGNDFAYKQKDTIGNLKTILKIDASNDIRVGAYNTGWGADTVIYAGDDLIFRVNGASGSHSTIATWNQSGGGQFNSGSLDYNWQFLGVTDSFLLMVNAGTDRVGVGIEDPAAKLHVETGTSVSSILSADADELLLESSGNAGMTIRTPDANSGYIHFTDTGADKGKIYYAHNADSMTFTTNGSTALRLHSTGDAQFFASVGIGTGSPDGPLHVFTASAGTMTANASADELVLENSGNAGLSILTPNTSAGYIMFGDPDLNAVGQIAYNHSNNQMLFYTAGNSALQLLSNQNAFFVGSVGIKTSSPDGSLHVFSGSSGSSILSASADDLIIENSANAGITIRTPDANAGWIMFTDTVANSGYIYYDHSANAMGFATAGTPVLSFLSNQVSYFQGNVGILTASPDGTLHVHTASAGTVTANANGDDLVIENSATGGLTILTPNTAEGRIYWGDPEDNDVAYITYEHSANAMGFVVDATNVGFQILPGLTVVNPTSADIDFRVSSDNQTYMLHVDAGLDRIGIKTNTPDGTLHVFSDSAGTVTANTAADDLVIENSGSAGLSILTPNTAVGYILFGDPDNNAYGQITYSHTADAMGFVTGGTQKFSIDSSGYGYIERMYFGTNDTTVGQLVLYGDSADTGGRIFLFNSANNDTVFDYYLVRNVYDDLYIESGDNKVRHILRGTDYSQEFFTGSAVGGTLAMTIGASQGLVIGSATGGDKGAGTINVSSNIYKNNTAYTNPDFVLEHWATGQIEKYKNRERASLYVPMTIYEIEDYAKKNWRLPGITDEPAGVFDMTDIALELLERLYIVTIDQQHTIDGLENKILELERRLQ